MIKTLKKHFVEIAVGLAAFLFVGTGIALANPSYFGPTTQTGTATTTVAYMTPGAATTTLVFNAYTGTNVATATPGGSGIVQALKADKVDLLLQFTGSSTSAVAKVTFEYTQDGIDWYQNFVPFGGYSTTTIAQSIGSTPFSITMPYASTTIGGAGGLLAVDKAIVEIPVPTKAVRAVITLTGANAGVWAQFVPTYQVR